MVIDPATAMLIATAINTGAQAIGGALSSNKAKKAGKLRSKELKRETFGNLLNDAMQRGSEIQESRMKSGTRIGQRKAQNLNDTATLMRGAFGL
jgi:hypothetical protein